MKTDCIKYNECRLPVTVCKEDCKLYRPVLWVNGVAVAKKKAGKP